MPPSTGWLSISASTSSPTGTPTDPSSAGFHNLIRRLEEMLGSSSAQIEHFDVKIDGDTGVLILRPGQLVSAAVFFVPESEVSV